jgi:hypothetical protein
MDKLLNLVKTLLVDSMQGHVLFIDDEDETPDTMQDFQALEYNLEHDNSSGSEESATSEEDESSDYVLSQSQHSEQSLP